MFGLKHFSLEWNKGQKFDDENKNIHGLHQKSQTWSRKILISNTNI